MNLKNKKIILLLVFSLLVLPGGMLSAQIVFMDDFEDGDLLDDWSSYGTDSNCYVEISTNFVHNGDYAYAAKDHNGGGSNARVARIRKNLGTMVQGDFYVRAYVYLNDYYLDTLASNKYNYIISVVASDGKNIDYRLHEDYIMVQETWDWHVRNWAADYNDDRWYCLEVHIPSCTTGAQIEWWVDGDTQTVTEASDMSTGVYWDYIDVGLNYCSDQTIKPWVGFDNFVISESYIGPSDPPSTISDLTASAGTLGGEVDLDWTAPGSSGDTGTASSYTMRYSSYRPMTDDWFDDGSLAEVWVSTTHNTGQIGSHNETLTGLSIHGYGSAFDVSDSFHMVYTTITGNFDVVTKVVDQPTGAGYDHCGLMARNSISSGDNNSDTAITITPGQGLNYLENQEDDGHAYMDHGTVWVTPTVYPAWLRLVRTGNVFTAYYSTSGPTEWSQFSASQWTQDYAADTMIVGLYASGNCVTEFEYIDTNWWDNATDATGEPSPSPAGSDEEMTVDGLVVGNTYYFGLRSNNEFGDISNISLGAKAIPTEDDDTAPDAITTLEATTGNSSGEIDLTWLAPGDDGMTGTLSGSYRIHYSTDPAVTWSTNTAQVSISTSSVNPYDPQGRTAGSLSDGTTYYFRIWTEDNAGNWSGLSNIATAWALRTGAQVVFYDNFEDGDLLDDWSSYGTDSNCYVEISTNLAYNGDYTYAARDHNGGGSNARFAAIRKNLGTMVQGDFYVRAYVYLNDQYLDTLATGKYNYIISVVASNGKKIDYRLHEDYIAVHEDWDWTNRNWAADYNDDRWYCLEVHIPSCTTSAQIEWWVDGEKQTSTEASDMSSGVYWNYIDLGLTYCIDQTIRPWVGFDNFVIAESYIGPTEPPSTVFDLSASSGTQGGEVDLDWTAPGSSGDTGTASSYTLRYSSYRPMTDDWFDDGSLADIWVSTTHNYPIIGSHNETLTGLAIHGHGGIYNYDQFHLVYTTITGNFDVETKVTGQQGSSADMCGLMARNTINSADNNSDVCVVITPGSGFNYLENREDDSEAFMDHGSNWRTPTVYPGWLRLVRAGNSFTGYYATCTAKTWQYITEWTQDYAADTMIVGLCATGNCTTEYEYFNAKWWPNATDATGEPTPSAPGSDEEMTVDGLVAGNTYYFGLRTVNAFGDISNISLGAKAIATEEDDDTAPDAITTLEAVTGGSTGEVDLTWLAPGDDGMTGTLSGSYRIHYSTDPAVTWSTTTAQVSISTSSVSPYDPQGRTADSLPEGTTYYFRIWAQDNAGNWSGLSNIATAWAMINPKNVLSVSYVDTKTVYVYFDTTLDTSAEIPGLYTLSPSISVNTATRKDSNTAVELSLAAAVTHNEEYTVTAEIPGVVSNSSVFTGSNPEPVFHDDFNRPDDSLETDDPHPWEWDERETETNCFIGTTDTIKYAGGYSLYCDDPNPASGARDAAVKTYFTDSDPGAAMYADFYMYFPSGYLSLGSGELRYIVWFWGNSHAPNDWDHCITMCTREYSGDFLYQIAISTYNATGAMTNVFSTAEVTEDEWHRCTILLPPCETGQTIRWWIDGEEQTAIGPYDHNDDDYWGRMRLGLHWSNDTDAVQHMFFDSLRISTNPLTNVSVLSASLFDDRTVRVYFSDTVGFDAEVPGNYSLSPPVSVSAASRRDNDRCVELTLATNVENSQEYMITVSSLTELTGTTTAYFNGVHPTPWFFDDFNRPYDSLLETDTPAGKWDDEENDAGNPATTDTVKQAGAYSYMAADTSASDYAVRLVESLAGLTTFYCRFYVYLENGFLTALNDGTTIDIFSFEGTGSDIHIRIDGSNNKFTFEHPGGPTEADEASEEQWYCFEVMMPSCTQDATMQWWIDGTEKNSPTGDLGECKNWEYLRAGPGVTGDNTSILTAYYDEVIVSTNPIGSALGCSVRSASYIDTKTIRVYFSDYVDTTAESAANYSLSPSRPVSAASRRDNNRCVELTLETAVSNGTDYTVTVTSDTEGGINGLEGKCEAVFTGINPAPLFSDDFNRPNDSIFTSESPEGKWDIADEEPGCFMGTTDTVKRSGDYAAYCDDPNSTPGADDAHAEVVFADSDPGAPVYVRVYFYLWSGCLSALESPGDTRYMVAVYGHPKAGGEDWDHAVHMSIKNMGGDYLYQLQASTSAVNKGAVKDQLSDAVATEGEWHSYEVLLPTCAPNQVVKWWIDGFEQPSLSALDYNEDEYWDRLRTGISYTNDTDAVQRVLYDDVMVSTNPIGQKNVTIKSASYIDTKTVRVYFSGSVGSDAETAGYYSLSPPRPVSAASRRDGDTCVELTLETAVSNGTDYTVTVTSAPEGGIEGLEGKCEAAFTGINPTPLFSDDFNRPDDSIFTSESPEGKWTDADEEPGCFMGTTDTVKHSGDYAAYCDDTNSTQGVDDAHAQINFASTDPGSPLFIRTYFYLWPGFLAELESNNDTRWLVEVFGYPKTAGDWDHVVHLSIQNQSGSYAYRLQTSTSADNEFPTAFVDGTATPTEGEWHSYEVLLPTCAPNQQVRWWIDGVEQPKMAAQDYNEDQFWGYLRAGLIYTTDSDAVQRALHDDIIVSTEPVGTGSLDVLSASYIDTKTIRVYFSDVLKGEAEYTGNYSLSPPKTVNSATRRDDNMCVELVLDNAVTNGQEYLLTVTGIGGLTAANTAYFTGINPTPIFSDDFNRPDDSLLTDDSPEGKWDQQEEMYTGTTDTVKNNGAYCYIARDTSTASDIGYVDSGSLSTVATSYIRTYFYLPSGFMDDIGNGHSRVLMQIDPDDSNGNITCGVTKLSGGETRYFLGQDDGSTETFVYSTSTVQETRWILYEVKCPSNTETAMFEWWLNGTRQEPITRDTRDSGRWHKVALGMLNSDDNSDTNDAYFDDIIVSSNPVGPRNLDVLSASYIDTETVRIYFSDMADSSADNAGNYSLNPSKDVNSATRRDNDLCVELKLDSELSDKQDYTVTVTGVNNLTSNNTAEFTGINPTPIFSDDFNRPEHSLKLVDTPAGPWLNINGNTAEGMSAGTTDYAVNNGKYSMFAGDDSATEYYVMAQESFTYAGAPVWARGYFYFGPGFLDEFTVAETERTFAVLKCDAENNQVFLQAKEDSGEVYLRLRTYDGTTFRESDYSYLPVEETWYSFEIKAPSCTPTATVEWWINGEQMTSIENNDFAGGEFWRALHVGCGWTEGGDAMKQAIYFDDLVLSSAAIGVIPDTIPPDAVTNLTALPSGSYIELTWTSPGDDALSNALIDAEFRIEYSTWPGVTWSTNTATGNGSYICISTANVNPGDTQSRTITGLEGRKTYYFRIWTRDEAHNWSGISNGATRYIDAIIGIYVSPASYDFGDVPLGGSSMTVSAIVVSNIGNVPETYSLKCTTNTADTPWYPVVYPSTSPAKHVFSLQGAFHAVQPSTSSFSSNDVLYKGDYECTGSTYTIDGSHTGVGVDIYHDRNMWFHLVMPLASNTTAQQDITVTFTATEE